MNYTLFLGCNIPARVQQYHDSAQAVCKKFDIKLTPLKKFMCCGYPVRNIDESAFLLSAARNLALAEQEQKDLMVLCKCCFGSLKIAEYWLQQNPDLLEKINTKLAGEDLVYKGNISVKHFLSVLNEDVGLLNLKKQIKRKFLNLKIAASVGCHALRPAKITNFDSPAEPGIFDDLVKLTGAESIEWSKKSECCGATLLGINDELSQNIMKEKLASARKAGAHFITVGCPYSFLQFDEVQSRVAEDDKEFQVLPPVLYPQLLGLSMNIDSDTLGIQHNKIHLMSLNSYLSQEN